MNRYACLLRAINVSGQRKIKMFELRDLCQSLKYGDIETYLQSGNIILSTKKSQSVVEEELSKSICQKFGYTDVDIFAWSAQELKKMYDTNPFIRPNSDPSKLHFTFLNEQPNSKDVKNIDNASFLPDEFSVSRKIVFVHCPNGYGRTKINNTFFERKLKLRATTRNLKTIQNLIELTSQ